MPELAMPTSRTRVLAVVLSASSIGAPTLVYLLSMLGMSARGAFLGVLGTIFVLVWVGCAVAGAGVTLVRLAVWRDSGLVNAVAMFASIASLFWFYFEVGHGGL